MKKTLRLYLFALTYCFAFILATQAQGDSPENKIKYQFTGDGSSFTIKRGWDNNRNMLRMQHSDERFFLKYDEYFNRAVKRGSTILVTGDKPRFSLMYTEKLNRVDPDLNKMGDGRIRITIDDKDFWLDLLPGIKTIFNPSSTEYEVSLPSYPRLTLKLLVSQAADWGAVARLSICNTSIATIQLKAALVYGGLRRCGRVFSAAYFSPDEKENLESNVVSISDGFANLSSSDIPGKLYVYSVPSVIPVLNGSRVLFSKPLSIKPNTKKQIYYITALSLRPSENSLQIKLKGRSPGTLIKESKNYYQRMLEKYFISSPSSLLDNGFKTAVLNFDNVYAAPAWLEGINWWSSYFANNYQISAAIALCQTDRAKKALAFFNSSEYGPSPVLTAAGKADAQSKTGEDGLPYYIYSLIQYYNSTGDGSLVLRVWPNLRKSIDLLWQNRDKDGDGLLNWHLGANAFLYQADHLEMPGDAASPSLMMAGLLDKISVVGLQLGQTEDARRWHLLAEKMYQNLEKILWDSKAGSFYNHRDEQGLYHNAHYYTDLVFPSLYTSLPAEYGWQSLDYLYRSLWINNYRGEKNLMRVGEFKPSIFGNDNVMPVQMAEAARAYFNQGDNEKGIRLLESIALAGTVFTEAPGNFPERMNDEGKGEANYLFGNPIASFIYSTVSGLFGLELKDQNKTMRWSPAFPDDWAQAELHLPYAKISYKNTREGSRVKRVYDCIQNESRKLDFSVYVEPAKAITLNCNGEKIKFTALPALGKTKVSFHFKKSVHHSIVIQYTKAKYDFSGSDSVHPGEKLQWEFAGSIEKIMDPQNALKNYSVADNKLNAFASIDTGWRLIFVQSKQIPVIYSVKFYVKPLTPTIPEQNPAIHIADIAKEQIVPLDISPWYNTDSLFLSSRWRYEYELRDTNYFSSVNDTTQNVFRSFGYSPKGKGTMALINNGISDAYTTETKSNGMPSHIEIAVNRKVQGLSFLWVTETQSRNTGINAGSIKLNYTNGEIKEIPLIVGKNLDASWKYFTTESEPVFLHGEDYAKIYSLRCNPQKELKSFSISLIASDVQVGIMGVNMILPDKQKLPLVGAIRWDGWFYDTANDITKILQKTLAPKEFHDRLPFFAKEISNDSVYINGSSQEVMDKEIAYAKAGKLDYWAFVLYTPGEKLALGLKNYLNSVHRRDINFSIITEQGNLTPSNTVYMNYITRLLQEPGFQLVENGRPLWYLGFVDSVSVVKTWGSFHNMKRALDSIRSAAMNSGLKNPYLVIMDFNAKLGKRWSDSLGGDAISCYATSKNSIKAPYKKLDEEAAAFWDECKATGSQVVPICMAGWSPKPRLDYPNVWSHFYPRDAYYMNATPAELADHVRKGLSWLQKNREAAGAQCVLIYAWNEYDEGGWLGPTLYYGTERLDALSAAIKEFKK
jgi:hypothetical protein